MLNALISFDSWNLYNWFYIAAYLIDGMSCAFGFKGKEIIFCLIVRQRTIDKFWIPFIIIYKFYSCVAIFF